MTGQAVELGRPEQVVEHLPGLTRSLDYGKEGLAVNATRICNADDCVRDAVARGMSLMHYKRWRNRASESERARPTLRSRFVAMIEVSPLGCWPWKGTLTNGYGYIRVDGVGKRAHRISYEMHVGVIPDGFLVDHLCHNRACVNPSHLRLATDKQNAENRDGAQANSSTGLRGVWPHTHGRFGATVQHGGKPIYLGIFSTAEEADQAARKMRADLFDVTGDAPEPEKENQT